MSRLAWFSPLPPQPGAWAALTAEILPRLSPEHVVEAFTPAVGENGRLGDQCQVFPDSAFETRQATQPFDLVVYELADTPRHGFVWPWLTRHPGLVILHDVSLHRSRAAVLLGSGGLQAYRAEFAQDHPQAAAGVVDVVRSGFGESQTRFWPMLRGAVAGARMVGVHDPTFGARVSEEFGVPAETIRLGAVDPPAARGADVRRTLGIAPERLLFVSTGRLTRDRRIPEVLQAFRTLARSGLPVHLLLVQEADEADEARGLVDDFGIADSVTVTVAPDADTRRDCLAASDVVLALGWPASGDAALAAVESMAAGRPTVVTSTTDLDAVAVLDPRTWHVAPSVLCDRRDPGYLEPACIAIDIVDEAESLRVALRRLAVDSSLRDQLGRQARRHWHRAHTLEATVGDYRRVIALALQRP